MNDSTITVPLWAVTELNLNGNELLVFSIIYEATKGGSTRFAEKQQYLCDTLNLSRQSISNILKSLIEKKIIGKESNGSNIMYYSNYIREAKTGNVVCKLSLHDHCIYNNTNINIDNIDKKRPCKESLHTTFNTEAKFEFGKPKDKKPRIWDKCAELIRDYTNDPELQKILFDYLSARLKMKDKPLYTDSQWKGMLNKLSRLSSDVKVQYQIVEKSIIKNWGSFFKLDNYSNSSAPNEGIQKQDDSKVDHSRAKDENGNDITF